MMRRVRNIYIAQFIRLVRMRSTLMGPVAVLVTVLGAYLSAPTQMDGVSDYAFVAYAAPIALNLAGLVMSLVFAASLVSGEAQSGTLRMTLTQPIRRRDYLAAQALIAITYTTLLAAIGGLMPVLLVLIAGDATGIYFGGEMIYSGAEMRNGFIYALCMNLPPLYAAAALGLLVSICSRTTSAAVAVAIAMWIVPETLKYPLHVEQLVFTTYLDTGWMIFADRCYGLESPFWPEAGPAIGVSVLYAFLLFGGAFWIFERRNPSG